MRATQIEQRFTQKYVVRGDCWEWTAALNSAGYGCFRDGPALLLAHRWSYENHVAPIPDGLHIDHLCRNRRCVNPDHLEAVSQRENTLRGASPAATHARKTHCIHGHEFTPENVITRPKGRECRACRDLKNKRRYQRKTA